MNKIGVVSADGASTLDALEAKLAEKAAAAGAILLMESNSVFGRVSPLL